MPNESQTPLAGDEWWQEEVRRILRSAHCRYCGNLEPDAHPAMKMRCEGDINWVMQEIPALLAEHKKRIRSEIEKMKDMPMVGYENGEWESAPKYWKAFCDRLLNHPCLKE